MDENIIIGALVGLLAGFLFSLLPDVEMPAPALFGAVIGGMAFVVVGDLKKRSRR